MPYDSSLRLTSTRFAHAWWHVTRRAAMMKFGRWTLASMPFGAVGGGLWVQPWFGDFRQMAPRELPARANTANGRRQSVSSNEAPPRTAEAAIGVAQEFARCGPAGGRVPRLSVVSRALVVKVVAVGDAWRSATDGPS